MKYITGRLNKLMLLLIIFLATLNLISTASTGKIDSSSLNNLYENLLQREYAGPISFPDHQVERKAQRSPSLRLRFGRSDPSMLYQTPSYILNDKRWFGDVNQKPIRSPSLRLRFGRRSDPSLMTNENSFLNDYNDDINNDFDSFVSRSNNKEKRKPSGRLRWGRSLSVNPDTYSNNNNNNYKNYDNYLQNIIEMNENLQTIDEKYPHITEMFLHGGLHEPSLVFNGGFDSLQALLKYLQEYDGINQSPVNEFDREIRKPAPLRLRWGRSTGTGEIQKNEQSKTSQSKSIDSANKNVKQENKA